MMERMRYHMPPADDTMDDRRTDGKSECEQTPSTRLALFRANGESIGEWARQRRFNPDLVYSILRGERKCLRGQSHLIAKALGLK